MTLGNGPWERWLRPKTDRQGPSPTAPLSVRLILLSLLPAIALALYLDGQRYTPDLLQLRLDGAATDESLFPDRLAGLKRGEKILRFGDDNLYEYIDGHAEYFLAAGFKGLQVAEYGTDPGQPNLVVNVYDLGTPLNAFGALVDEAGQRDSVGIGSMGFIGKQGLSFIHGPYYVQMSRFDASVGLEGPARVLADRLAAAVPAGDLGFEFPNLGAVESTRFVREGYRGLGFLDRVLERTFDYGGRSVQVFVVSGGREKTEAAIEDLASFLAEEGIPVEKLERSGLTLNLVHDPYEGEWFYLSLGDRLIGVFAPLDRTLETEILGFALASGPSVDKGETL